HVLTHLLHLLHLLHGTISLSVAHVVVERSAEVALAGRGEDGDDELASILGASGDLGGGPGSGAAADADEQPFFAGQAAGDLDGVVVRDLQDVVYQCGLQHGGDEARADALNLGGASLATGEHGGGGRLDSDGAEVRLARLKDLGDAGKGATSADTRDEHVYLAVGIAPQLLGGGGTVDSGIGWILELLRNPGARRLGGDLLGAGNGARHALCGGSQHHLGAQPAQHHAALHAHGLGHDEDAAVATGCRDPRQADASVAAGRLDDGRVVREDPLALRVV